VRSKTTGAGGDYGDNPTWYATITDTDDETNTFIEDADLGGGSTNVLSAPNTNPWTYMITADSGHMVNAATYAAASSKARIVVAVGSPYVNGAINIDGDGWVVEKIGIIASTTNTTPPHPCVRTTKAAVVRRCGMFTTTDGGGWAVHAKSGGTLTLDNCFVAASDLCVVAEGSVINAYECSFLGYSGARASVLGYTSQVNAYGCIAEGSFSQGAWWDLGGGLGGDYNRSIDATAPGAHSQQSQSAIFTNATPGSEDFALTSSPAFVDRSGFPSDTDTDFIGTSRPSTGADPGVWQTASSATTTEASSTSTSPAAAAAVADPAPVASSTGVAVAAASTKADGSPVASSTSTNAAAAGVAADGSPLAASADLAAAAAQAASDGSALGSSTDLAAAAATTKADGAPIASSTSMPAAAAGTRSDGSALAASADLAAAAAATKADGDATGGTLGCSIAVVDPRAIIYFECAASGGSAACAGVGADASPRASSTSTSPASAAASGTSTASCASISTSRAAASPTTRLSAPTSTRLVRAGGLRVTRAGGYRLKNA